MIKSEILKFTNDRLSERNIIVMTIQLQFTHQGSQNNNRIMSFGDLVVHWWRYEKVNFDDSNKV